MNYLLPLNACLENHWAKSHAGFTLFNARFHCITHRGCQNPVCRQLRRIKDLDRRCKACDDAALGGAVDHEYDCPWGMKEYVLHLPLDREAAHVIVGKYRRAGDEKAKGRFLSAIYAYHLDEKRLLADYNALPSLTQSESETLCRSLKAELMRLGKERYLQSFENEIALQTIEILHAEMNDRNIPAITRACRDLSFKLGMSKRSLDNLFSDLCGKSFFGFIRERLLVFAEHQLTNTKQEVKEIARKLNHHEIYFNALFERLCSLPPGKFREQGFAGLLHSLELPF